MPSPSPRPRLMLMLTTDTTAMPAPTPTDTATLTDTDTPTDTDTMARGPLMPRLPLRPTLMLCTDTTAILMDTVLMDTDTDTPTDTDTTARGQLMPSPRPRLRPMPLFSMELTDTPMVSPMVPELPPPTTSSDTLLPIPPVA